MKSCIRSNLAKESKSILHPAADGAMVPLAGHEDGGDITIGLHINQHRVPRRWRVAADGRKNCPDVWSVCNYTCNSGDSDMDFK